jgi:hypothetical protein
MDFVEQLKNTKAAPKAEQAEPEAPPAPAEKPAAMPEPKPEEAPPAKPEGETPPEKPADAPPEEAPAGEPEAKDEDEPEPDDGDLTPIDSKKIRVTPRDDDKVFRLQLRIMRRNRDLTGEEALARAKKELGLDKPADAPAAAPARKPDGLPDSIDAIDAAIAQAKADRKKASSNLELETYDTLTEKIESLQGKRGLIVDDQRQAQAQAVRDYNRGFAASQTRAENLYAFAAEPESPGGKLMKEIDDALEANGDPLFNHPDKPLKLAQMVATRLNIPPKTKSQETTKPAPPKPPAAPAVKKDVIPGGASRTTPQTAKPANPLDQKIQDPKLSAKDADKILRDLGILT